MNKGRYWNSVCELVHKKKRCRSTRFVFLGSSQPLPSIDGFTGNPGGSPRSGICIITHIDDVLQQVMANCRRTVNYH